MSLQKKYCKAEDGIPDGWMGLDIGKDTIEIISAAMSKCATVVWNGYLHAYFITVYWANSVH